MEFSEKEGRLVIPRIVKGRARRDERLRPAGAARPHSVPPGYSSQRTEAPQDGRRNHRCTPDTPVTFTMTIYSARCD